MHLTGAGPNTGGNIMKTLPGLHERQHFAITVQKHHE